MSMSRKSLLDALIVAALLSGRFFWSLLLSAVIFLVGSAFGLAAPVQAGGQSALRDRPPKVLPPQLFDMSVYDDVLQLHLQSGREGVSGPDGVDFPGSDLKGLTRVKVSCFPQTSTNRASQRVDCDNFKCLDGKVVSEKQTIAWPIKARDRVAVLLENRIKPFSDTELAACSAVLARLRLALSLNGNVLVAVRVPDPCMDRLIAELRRKNFYPYKEVRARLSTLIPIAIESDLGRKEMTCFAPE
ncbi:MAG: hypothetical protein KGS72_06355 [Cyanobacteria bacterium REEB67]|nr:hypothetical protein [Cyanobacteria bacterium REEB67]